MKHPAFEYHDNAQLKQAIIDGNGEAIKYLLYERCQPLLRFMAHTMRLRYGERRHLEYNDLVQELYLHLAEDNWRRMRLYDPKRDIEPWLAKLARMKWKNMYLLMTETALDDTIPIQETATMDESLKLDLTEAIAGLEPEIVRQVMRDIFFGGLTTEELCEKHNINRNQVYLIKSRALKEIRKRLDIYNTNKD